jgi:hypothetical protein
LDARDRRMRRRIFGHALAVRPYGRRQNQLRPESNRYLTGSDSLDLGFYDPQLRERRSPDPVETSINPEPGELPGHGSMMARD